MKTQTENQNQSGVKHTAGPWYAMCSPIDNHYWIQGQPDKDGIRDIARLNLYLNEATQVANARLIASAPQLLEALKNLLADYEDYSYSDGHNESIAIKEARDAIASAEGKGEV